MECGIGGGGLGYELGVGLRHPCVYFLVKLIVFAQGVPMQAKPRLPDTFCLVQTGAQPATQNTVFAWFVVPPFVKYVRQ